MEARFDEFYFTIAKEAGGIDGVLNSMFSFLLRRTDFYYESDPGDKMGFPPGTAASMVGTIFKKYQEEHYKKHKPKSVDEYRQKLKAYNSKPLEQPKQSTAEIQQVQNQQDKQPQPVQQPKSQEQQSQQQQQKQQLEFNTYNGGTTDLYSWSQTGQDVTVGIPLKEYVNKKQIKVEIKSDSLFVKVKDQVIVDGKVYDKIKADDSVWSIEDNLLTLTLEKANDNIWKTVIQGHQEIDATKVENTKPLEEFDPETQGALRKIMYEQQRKQMGLPTTEEESQMEMLKKAWDAEGSPFKGQPFDPSKLNLGNQQFQM